MSFGGGASVPRWAAGEPWLPQEVRSGPPAGAEAGAGDRAPAPGRTCGRRGSCAPWGLLWLEPVPPLPGQRGAASLPLRLLPEADSAGAVLRLQSAPAARSRQWVGPNSDAPGCRGPGERPARRSRAGSRPPAGAGPLSVPAGSPRPRSPQRLTPEDAQRLKRKLQVQSLSSGWSMEQPLKASLGY